MQDTLQDYIRSDLRLLSVGINPSLGSVAAGYPFASKGNRFWPALNASKLISTVVQPSIAGMERLLEKDRIGFTDIVKRPSRGVKDLCLADYRRDAPKLLGKILRFKPGVVCFQGMTAARQFFHCAGVEKPPQIAWGAQPESSLPFRIFVSPNPSAANAKYSLDDLVRYFNQLARFMDQLD